jgi:hypothetical protein
MQYTVVPHWPQPPVPSNESKSCLAYSSRRPGGQCSQWNRGVIKTISQMSLYASNTTKLHDAIRLTTVQALVRNFRLSGASK